MAKRTYGATAIYYIVFFPLLQDPMGVLSDFFEKARPDTFFWKENPSVLQTECINADKTGAVTAEILDFFENPAQKRPLHISNERKAETVIISLKIAPKIKGPPRRKSVRRLFCF